MAKKLLLLLLSVGACNQQPSTPLNKLDTTFGATTLEVVAGGQLNILLRVEGADAGNCPVLASDVAAQFDGLPMNVARGGIDVTSDACYPIAFWIQKPPLAAMAAWELSSSAGSQMVVTDSSATWTIAPTRLFANEFVDDPAAGRITWMDVTLISQASVLPSVAVHIDGNAIVYPVGVAIQSVNAYAHPIPTVCDGPSLCTVDLTGSHAFFTPPPL